MTFGLASICRLQAAGFYHYRLSSVSMSSWLCQFIVFVSIIMIVVAVLILTLLMLTVNNCVMMSSPGELTRCSRGFRACMLKGFVPKP